jgi:hypothetical protein
MPRHRQGSALFPFLTYTVLEGLGVYMECIGLMNLSTQTLTPAIDLFSPNQFSIPATFKPGLTPCSLSLSIFTDLNLLPLQGRQVAACLTG